MKILFIAPRYSGGIGGHANRVAKKLRENGIEVDLMRVPHIPIKKLKNPTFMFNSVIKSIFTRKKYDVVHAFNIPSAFAMKYINANKKVLSIHGVYSEQIDLIHSNTTSMTVKNTELKIMKWADKLLTNSKNVQITYKKKYNINFDYIFGPIDLEKFEHNTEIIPKEKNQIVYIGRDSYEKGIDILKEIESEINGKILYCTNLDWEETMRILRSSKILVVPSRIDNIPNVIKEAFYLKIPVVASDIEGISEIIQHKENGILVPVDNKNQFVLAINNLIKDDQLIEKLTNSAYDYLMKNFTWEILLPKYLKFYEDLIKK